MAKKTVKKCVACLGKIEGYGGEKITHKDGRTGMVHHNHTCRYRAEKAGWNV